MVRPSHPLLSADGFQTLLDTLPRHASRGFADPGAVLAARALIQDGGTVACGEGPAEPALDADADTVAHVAQPYRLRQGYGGFGDWRALNDRLEIDIHGGAALTHIDALNHFSWRGEHFGGIRPRELGELVGYDALADLADGIVGRGVLIDVPGLTGEPIPPGHVIELSDLQSALRRQGVELHPGDVLSISFGRTGARRSDVPLGSEPAAGVSIEAAAWIAERRPSVIVTDNGMDGFPTEVDGVPVPWHVVLLATLGIPMVDLANLGALADACAKRQRWEYFTMISPLRVPFASGSPVNPIAVF